MILQKHFQYYKTKKGDYMSFYNIQSSYKGSIQLDFGANGCSLRFTPVFKPVSPRDIQKGMKIYNYDAAQFFTITIDELVVFEQIIDSLILDGPKAFAKYSGDYGTIKVQESGISLLHYPKGKMSKIALFVTQGDNGQSGLMFGYELSDSNKNSEFKLYLSITTSTLLILKKYINAQYTFMATMDAIDRDRWAQKKAANNRNGNNGGNSGGYSRNNGNNSGGGNSYGGGNSGGGYSGGGNSYGGGHNSGGGNNYSNNGGGNNYHNNGGGNGGGNNNFGQAAPSGNADPANLMG
jgi:hypothetical protein